LMKVPGGLPGEADEQVIEQLEIQAKYQGYIDRQKEEVERHREQEELKLPDDFDYMLLAGLSIEVRQRLNQHKPETLGQASRLQGITPAAISVLMVYAKRGFRFDADSTKKSA